ncbi:hypothetical protein BCR33DRAFT_725459, partial [Rhizoclosmatium globosum]
IETSFQGIVSLVHNLIRVLSQLRARLNSLVLNCSEAKPYLLFDLNLTMQSETRRLRETN